MIFAQSKVCFEVAEAKSAVDVTFVKLKLSHVGGRATVTCPIKDRRLVALKRDSDSKVMVF